MGILCGLFEAILLAEATYVAAATSVVFIPLDERFATRGLFLHLAELAAPLYQVITPPKSMISLLHKPADLAALDSWMDEALPAADVLIVSLEMYVYGGLIASRESNDTLAAVSTRSKKLLRLKDQYPGLKVYASSVVMRIPAYNGAFEEPWYWENYGLDLYSYSFYASKFNSLGDKEDAEQRDAYASLIPPNVMGQFLWRRSRNANVSLSLLDAMGSVSPDENGIAGGGQFDAFFITEDDSSTFGFNVDEADRLRGQIQALGLNQDIARVYPGADEVQSAMLARAVIHGRKLDSPLCAKVVYRVPESQRLEPSYESQNLSTTVKAQVEAAGLSVCSDKDGTSNDESSESDGQLILVVNNFESLPQLEASQQTAANSTGGSAFRSLDAVVDNCVPERGDVLAIADSRYSNGGDLDFAAYLRGKMLSKLGCVADGSFAYAGWNTNGNTLGTAIANGVLLSLFGRSKKSATFTLLRLIEDLEYQSVVRQVLISFVEASTDSILDLAMDLNFYQRFSFKPLAARAKQWAGLLSPQSPLPELLSIYYPWNRTFEIGLELGEEVSLPASSPTQGVEGSAAPGLVVTETRVHSVGAGKNENKAIDVECDIVVAGGSTASLAAAIAAADTAAKGTFGKDSLMVCLTEPTTWPGGQLTSSLVTAVDYGLFNALVPNLPFEFAKIIDAIGDSSFDSGECWVSDTCYEARVLLEKYIWPALYKRSNLKILLNTVIKKIFKNEETGEINEILAVRRSEKSASLHQDGANLRGSTRLEGFRREGSPATYSSVVSDWYSTEDSKSWTKNLVRLRPRESPSGEPLRIVVVEGTELGDVLALSSSLGGGWTQGYDTEGDELDMSMCGQAVAFPLYLELIDAEAPEFRSPTEWAPQPQDNHYALDNYTIDEVWAYRRVLFAGDAADDCSPQFGCPAAPGDVSLAAWGAGAGEGNDYPYAFHLLSAADTVAEAASGDWRGGVNVDALSAAESYALGFASWFNDRVEEERALGREAWVGGLRIDTARAGSASGLSKLPYVRDTRRAVGLGGFRLAGGDLVADPAAPPIACPEGGVATGRRFEGEEVALGDYLFFDVHLLDATATGCPPPALPQEPLAPYFVPFRALTSAEVPNLLVCGKTMAQDFAANAATRLHPVEWATGAAAGVAAVLLASHVGSNGAPLTTADVFKSSELLESLRNAIAQDHAPLEWNACP